MAAGFASENEWMDARHPAQPLLKSVFGKFVQMCQKLYKFFLVPRADGSLGIRLPLLLEISLNGSCKFRSGLQQKVLFFDPLWRTGFLIIRADLVLRDGALP